MHLPVLLWICAKVHSLTRGVGAGLSAVGRVHRCSPSGDIPATIADIKPDVLCFDYEHPTAGDLSLLRDTQRENPSLPILMFSQEHSAELAIWALRTRVWDYFTKPVEPEELRARLNMLARAVELQHDDNHRDLFMSTASVPEVTSDRPRPTTTAAPTSMSAAIDYVASHYHEKIPLATVARLCRMGTFEFSRAFRRQQGITFRDYLTQWRVNEAARLLMNSKTSVLEVAYTVGFNDPSHFARMFRRCLGVAPTVYRLRNRQSRRFIPVAPGRSNLSLESELLS